MLVVISYDVSCDKRRYRLARLLSGYGNRVQYSVFEAHVAPATLRALQGKAKRLIRPDEDSVRFYRLGETYKHRVDVLGVGSVTVEPTFKIH